MYYIHSSHSPLHLFAKELMVGTIIHIRGAFSVARFDLQGNRRPSCVERASGLAPRFFICMQTSFKISRQEGAIGKNIFLFMKTTFTL